MGEFPLPDSLDERDNLLKSWRVRYEQLTTLLANGSFEQQSKVSVRTEIQEITSRVESLGKWDLIMGLGAKAEAISEEGRHLHDTRHRRNHKANQRARKFR